MSWIDGSSSQGDVMSSESLQRLALLGMVVAFMPIGIYHRYKAHTGERLRRRDEGLFVMVGLRLCGLAAWLAVMTELLNPRLMDWARVDLPHWLRWVGLPVGILAGCWLAWMFRTLGTNLTDTVTVRTEATLVTGGPYRWVRHPFYLGVAMLIVSISLLTA